MNDRDYDYPWRERGGGRAYDRDVQQESGSYRDSGYGRGGMTSGRDWERDEFMLERRGYGGRSAGGYGYGGPASRRFQDWRDDRGEQFDPGQGEIMVRPGMMRTSTHDERDYERGGRNPGEHRGFWGQGGVGGMEYRSDFGPEAVWEGDRGRGQRFESGGYGGRQSGGDYERRWQSGAGRGGAGWQSLGGAGSGIDRQALRDEGYSEEWEQRRPERYQTENLYRAGGMTREGRQFASRQGGIAGPYAGRGPKGYRRSDDRIREDVCEALSEHDAIDACEIEIQVREGEVTLTGTVEDRWQKRLAEDILESVSGVRDIHNHLRVQQRYWQEGGPVQADQLATSTAESTSAPAGRGGTSGQTAGSSRAGRASVGGEADRVGANAHGSPSTR